MSIKEQGKSARGKWLKAEYPERYVVAETTIREFVESLGIFDVEEASARFQAVADATNRLLEDPMDPNSSDIRLILRIAGESKSRRYQQIMRAIISGMENGPAGIKAAHRTAHRIVELAFTWTPDYALTFKQFTEGLQKGRATRGTPSYSKRRSIAL
jgi:hypothetical protein